MTELKGRMAVDESMEDDDDDDDSQRDKYLTFRIGEEDFAISIDQVLEIVGIQPVTEVPDMPPYVRGVINLRGRVIPAIDVRLRFDMDEKDYNSRTCMVVVDLKGTAIALIVDTVNEVLSIPTEAISPPPAMNKGYRSRFVRALGRVGNAVKIVLDLDKLLMDGDQETIGALGN